MVSLESYIKYYPPPLGENFLVCVLVIKMSSIVKLSVIVHCMLQLHCKCINFSLHLFRSQRVIYTELSLSIKQIRSGLFDWSKEKQDFLNSDLFHFSPLYLTYFSMRHIFSEQRRLPGFRSILSVQFFFEL